MQYILILGWLLISFMKTGAIGNVLSLNGVGNQAEHFQRFWTSTGFSPIPIENMTKFVLSKDEEINLALIGAVPNNGITHVRIHWLLDLIIIDCKNNTDWKYNYGNLFKLITQLKINGLSPGFELMANPSDCFENWTQFSAKWPMFLINLLDRLIDEFGYDYVRKWRFETLNEPDLKMYNTLGMTPREFMSYLKSSADTLSNFNINLWGPAGLFKNQSHHPLCWGLLDYCHTNQCPIKVLTFHKKGNGVASQVVHQGRDLVLQIRSIYPRLNFSYANDEADPMQGWIKPMAWRADVRYAAAVAQNVIGHWHSFKEINAPLTAVSNDNGFLSFSPNYWTQRTLLARFQMNNTHPVHVQMFKKPVLVVMEILSLLGDTIIGISYSLGHPGVSYMITKDKERLSFLVTINNDSLVNSTWKAEEKFNRITLKLPQRNSSGRARTYLIDNKVTNPYHEWEVAGRPDYPDETLRRKLRKKESPRQQEFVIESNQTYLNLEFTISAPAIIFINICYDKNLIPGAPQGFRYIPVTHNEVLFLWNDSKVNSRCLKSYVIEFRPKNMTKFKIIPTRNFLSTSYHRDGCNPRIKNQCHRINIAGDYRVATMDMWNQLGPYSGTITLLINRKPT